MEIDLVEVGVIRFGPRYFNLIINNQQIYNRIFGDEIYYSNDNKYIVLQEWLSTDYSKGPVTRPLVIDIEKSIFTSLSEGKKGFSSNFDIKDGILIYKQINKGSVITRIYEYNLSHLKYACIEKL